MTSRSNPHATVGIAITGEENGLSRRFRRAGKADVGTPVVTGMLVCFLPCPAHRPSDAAWHRLSLAPLYSSTQSSKSNLGRIPPREYFPPSALFILRASRIRERCSRRPSPGFQSAVPHVSRRCGRRLTRWSKSAAENSLVRQDDYQAASHRFFAPSLGVLHFVRSTSQRCLRSRHHFGLGAPAPSSRSAVRGSGNR